MPQAGQVRLLWNLVCLTIGATATHAQEQENKLVERLLRPNMTLSNPAQDKKFNGTAISSVEKQFVARTFAARPSHTKTFVDSKPAATRSFPTEQSAQAPTSAQVHANAESNDRRLAFRTQESSLMRSSPSVGKVAATHTYAEGDRPFLVQGTRQKILDRQPRPLTIDEVRELLNKSK